MVEDYYERNLKIFFLGRYLFPVTTLLYIWSYKYSEIYKEYEYMAVLYGKLGNIWVLINSAVASWRGFHCGQWSINQHEWSIERSISMQ